MKTKTELVDLIFGVAILTFIILSCFLILLAMAVVTGAVAIWYGGGK